MGRASEKNRRVAEGGLASPSSLGPPVQRPPTHVTGTCWVQWEMCFWRAECPGRGARSL